MHNQAMAAKLQLLLIKFVKWLSITGLLLCLFSALLMTYVRFVDPPSSNFIRLNAVEHNVNVKHQWLPLEDISLYLPVAVLASEDQQFPDHFGFDLTQIKLALQQNQSAGSIKRGASTVTQQTVKNLFLWPGRSLIRKGMEAWLTIWMELIVPKRRILELYVNFAQFGTTVFGASTASQYYFGIEASQLNSRQAALLAASLPTPARSNPSKPSDYLNKRADFIEDQMPRIGGRRLIREL